MHVYDVSGSIIDGLQHSPTIDIKQQGYQLVTSFLLFCWKHLLAILAPLLGWKELFPVSITDKENIFEWYYQGFSAISAFGINNTHILSFGIRKIRFIFYWNVMNALCSVQIAFDIVFDFHAKLSIFCKTRIVYDKSLN